jgi:predicted DNA-binding ribbon-helix-helix protein
MVDATGNVTTLRFSFAFWGILSEIAILRQLIGSPAIRLLC